MSSTESPAPGSIATTAEGDVLDSRRAGPLALRGSVLRVVGYGGGMLLALVSAPLLIRHLGQVGFGHYITAIAIVTIAASLTEGGVNAIALREFASQTGSVRDDLMAHMLGIRIALNVVGVLGSVAFAMAAGYNSTLVLGTAVAGIGVMTQSTQSLLSIPLQGTMRFGWVASADLLRQAISTALIVTLVLLGAQLVGLLAVAIPASLATLVLTLWLVRGTMPLRPAFNLWVWFPMLRETFPYAVAIALNSVYFRMTVVIVSLSGSALQAGYFSTSFRVVEILVFLPALVISAAYPIVARAERDDPARFRHATRRMFELSVLTGAWVALALELGAPFIVEVLGGAAAAPAGAVLRIQGLAVMGTFVAVACTFPMLSLRRHRELLLANALGLAATLTLALSLVPLLEARGAAIATVGAELVLALTVTLELMRARPDVRLPLSAVPVALLSGLAGVGAGHLSELHPMLEVLIGTIVYAAALAALGRFPPEILHALHGSSPRGPAGVAPR
jgi:O-antigen/teichoic acid export membrane protein